MIILWDICATAISFLGGLVVMMLSQTLRDQGSIPHWGTEFFRIANRHLFDPLLHLVANLISELEMHEGE